MTQESRWRLFQVGAWTVEPPLNQISRGNQVVRLEPKVMAVLEALARRPGEVVSRDELLQEVWSDVAVTDNVVARAVASLRKQLGDDWRRPVYVETISKGGYRLVAPVEPAAADEPASDRSSHRVESTRAATRRSLVLGAAVLLATALLVLGVWRVGLVSPERNPPAVYRSVPVTTTPGREMYPALSPDGTRVAFVRPTASDGDLESTASWEIFYKTIGSHEVRRVSDRTGQDSGPTWSPDGERIAWYHTASSGTCLLFVSDRQGTAPTPVSACGHRIMGRLAWSPDGLLLASSEATSPTSPRRIVLTRIATGERRFLTKPPGDARGDQYPAFSPDGERVAFTRAYPDGRGDLYVVSTSGGTPRRLSSRNRIIMGLDWTASGEHLVYSSSYDGSPALWSLPASGGQPSRLPVPDQLVYWPSLARRSDRLVYSSYDDDTNLYAIDLAEAASGSPGPRLVAGSTRQELQPALSPDGQQLAYVSNRSGYFEIYTADLDGGDVRQRSWFEGPVVGMPSWSPGGRNIVFQVRDSSGIGLYRLALTDGRPERLTDGVGNELNAAWSSDGEWLYYASDQSGDWQIWRTGKESEQVQQVTRHGGFRAMEDPSGKTLLFFKHDRPGIWQLPLEGGPERLLIGEMVLSEYSHWTVAEDGIWFVRRGVDGGLAFYDFETQQSVTRYRPTKLVPYTPSSIAVTADGGTIVFVQVERSESDIVLLDRPSWTG